MPLVQFTVYCFARWSSDFVTRTARFLSYSVQVFGFPLWRNLKVKYSYHCLIQFFRFLNRFETDAKRCPEITNSLSTDYTFITDYQSGIVIKRKCNTSSKVGISVVFVGYIIFYIITKLMRALWLANQLWVIVLVNPRKIRASSELLYKSNRPEVSIGYGLINHLRYVFYQHPVWFISL